MDFKTKTSTDKQQIEDQQIMVDTCPKNFVPKFSILMPVHNEDDSITDVVMDVHDKLGKNPQFTFEIILAEDGSNDNTKQVIIELSKKIPLKAILSYERKGYAGGIKEGLDIVSSPYVLFCDSDGQHKPEDFWKLNKKLEEFEHPEYVIVSGRRITRADPFHRQLISKTFQKLNGIMFDLSSMEDITSPLKLMHTSLAKSIASECKFMRESFWTEFIVRANHRKIAIVEVPVQHSSRMRGESVVYKKSKIPKIVIKQLNGLVHLKKELTGKGLIKSLFETRFIKRLISFALVGASGAGIILSITWLLVSIFNLNYLLSAAIAIELSIIWAFFLNNRFTFRDKVLRQKSNSHWYKRLLKYNMSALSGETINLLLLFVLTNAGFFYLTSEAVAILVVFVYNFTMSNKWVWADKRKSI